MTASYRERLQAIRQAFPQPVSDRVHDSYFVHSIMRAVDAVDALKSDRPILGERQPLDYQAARTATLPREGMTVEAVTNNLVGYASGLTIWGHPRTQQNVVPPPTISSLIGILLASMYNPNLGWDEYSHRVALAEVELVAMTARLLGYDPEKAGGLSTFGGTGTTMYGMRIGIEKALPGAMETGIREDAVILASEASHYCRYNIAGWLGLGANNLYSIPTDTTNAMRMDLLQEQARGLLQEGRKIAGIIATLGTTDAFGLDDVAAITAMRDEWVREFSLPYVPHIHADAVIGWAWAVFIDYDFEHNPLGFRPRTLRALAGVTKLIRHLALADSIGVDFHKSGFTPYISSLFLVQDQNDFEYLRRPPQQMPYLYQFGEYRPGMYTLETSRPGTGVMSALANLKLFGQTGFQVVIGHIVEMAQLLREHLEGHASTVVLNRENFGPVTLFRVYPDGVDTFQIKDLELKDSSYQGKLRQYNEYNRRVFEVAHAEGMAGRGIVLSLTECYRLTEYGEPVVALKSFILSPFVDKEHIEIVVRNILEARETISASSHPNGESGKRS